MKKQLITLSIFTLFAGAAMSENYIGGNYDGQSVESSIDSVKINRQFDSFIGGNYDPTGDIGTGDVRGNIKNNLINVEIKKDFVGGNATVDSNPSSGEARLVDIAGSISNILANETSVGGNLYGGSTGGSVEGDVITSLQGTVVNGNVYGGGIDDIIQGSTQIDIDGETRINGTIYGGSTGLRAKVLGNTTVRFLSTNDFSGTVDGYGENGAGVSGSRKLVFGGTETTEKWTGDFGGTIKNINSIELANGSQVSNVKLALDDSAAFDGDGTIDVVAERAEIGGSLFDAPLVTVGVSKSLAVNFKDSKIVGNRMNSAPNLFASLGEGKMNFENALFESNKIANEDESSQFRGIIHYGKGENGYGGSSEINDTVFSQNTVSAGDVQGSCVYADVYTTINGSQFLFNNSIASGSSNISGGAIYLDGSSGSLAIKNSVFRGNYVSNSSDNSLARGGAISFNSSGLLHVTDSLFADNTAGKGGAIYIGANQSILLTATKSMEYSGNNAENGGFLYMDTGTQINIHVEKGATLTIGNNDSANSGTLDSFESADVSAEIWKDKDGALVVKGSMAQFKGRLYVQNGTMNVNNGLGAPYIYIGTLGAGSTTTAKLNIKLGNGTLENAKIFNNANGLLVLRRGTQTSNLIFSYCDMNKPNLEGKLEAYGGVLVFGTSNNGFYDLTFVSGNEAQFVSGSPVRVGGDIENDA